MNTNFRVYKESDLSYSEIMCIAESLKKDLESQINNQLVSISYGGHSTTNGLSIYLIASTSLDNKVKIRFSDHDTGQSRAMAEVQGGLKGVNAAEVCYRLRVKGAVYAPTASTAKITEIQVWQKKDCQTILESYLSKKGKILLRVREWVPSHFRYFFS